MHYDAANIFSKVILSEKKCRIKLLGDSITHGVGGSGWTQEVGEPFVDRFVRSPKSFCWANLLRDFMESQYNCEVINNGCTGTTIEFVIAHFDTLVDAEDDIIVCTIGTNNRHRPFRLGEKLPKAEFARNFYNNIGKLDAMFKATGKDYIFVANIPAAPQNEKDGSDFWRILHMNDIHDLYVKASYEFGFPLVDLYTAFLSYCDVRNIDYTTLLCDGLHPNDDGYKVMYKLLLREFGLGMPMHRKG